MFLLESKQSEIALKNGKSRQNGEASMPKRSKPKRVMIAAPRPIVMNRM